jgi:hypothetical protein
MQAMVCLTACLIVLVVVLRPRLGIEPVCTDGRRINWEIKRRKFRSYHPKTDEDDDD